MARITPAAGIDLDRFQDYEPYRVTLLKFEWTTSSAEYGNERRLQIDWTLEDGATIRDWLSLRLGKQQDGQVSKLRALLNALTDKPEGTDIAWFDDETAEWGYTQNGSAENKLTEGMEVVVRGKASTKADGKRTFRVTVYQSAQRTPAPHVPPVGEDLAQRASAVREAVAGATNTADVPF